MAAEHILHLEWRLVRMNDRERAFARIEVGDQAARLQRHRHLALESELLLDHEVGLGERLGGLALLDREIESDVVGELGMDGGRARSDGLELIAYHRQRLPIDGHQFGRVLRLCPAVGDDHRDGLALPDGAVRGQQPLRGGAMARPMQCDADERLAARVDVARDQHRGDARRLLCGFDVHRNDFCVRVRTAHKAGMQHPRQLDVVDVAAMPAEQPFQLAPRDARADAGGRGGERGGGNGKLRHQRRPRVVITASTASMMA